MNADSGDGRHNKRGSAVLAPAPRRAPRPAGEDELGTGEPLPDGGESAAAAKKIPARRVTADGRLTAAPPPTPAGQIVLSCAKYLPASAFDEPESSKGRKKGGEPKADSTARSFEGRVLNGGVWGGLLAMTVAVLWFAVGLMDEFIYFYPPILFVLGLVSFCRGGKGGE